MSAGDWLGLEGRTVVVAGVANRRSVGFHVGKRLQEAGAKVIWVVHTEERRAELAERLSPDPVHVCDVAKQDEVDALGAALAAEHPTIHGLVHSIAFARYREDSPGFTGTRREDFLEAMDVSAFSLVALTHAIRPVLAADASIVTISISTTRMAAENYGLMGPVKAALDSAVVFLAKDLSEHGEGDGVRCNAVCAGPLKTSSSAGIPGYLDSWLYAEMSTLRHRGLETGEVADTTLWLLSPRSSGINAQGIVVDAGMGVNHFDGQVVQKAVRPDPTELDPPAPDPKKT